MYSLARIAAAAARNGAWTSTAANSAPAFRVLHTGAGASAQAEPSAEASHVLQFGVRGPGQETITKVVNYTGKHSIALDEPVFLGGKDSAPNPVEYLLASLVGCIQVTTHVIAAERKLRLGPINWDANGDIDLRGFLGEKGVFPGFQRINVTATIPTDASAEQVAQLHEAVLARCPVGNTIKAPGVQYTLKFAKA